MKALRWVRSHIVWILGGLVTILAAILAVTYEKDKLKAVHLGKKMDALNIEKYRVERMRQSTDEAVSENYGAQKKIEEKLKRVDSQIEEVRNEVRKMDTDEVVDRFNRIYSE